MSDQQGIAVTAPMVGKLVEFKVKPGDAVKEDDVVAVIEAMKMLVDVYAPASGIVQETIGIPGEVV
ncbi:MAG: acetyl-CoA carboxylase biotin carboxyl carrier protein subunit, partial [Clostridia bacterium]|nr:acetyl-CoA carboxylase biotin carboxyl carrier protein subunit [Clostridia bacterium]